MVRFHSIVLSAACLSGTSAASLRGEQKQKNDRGRVLEPWDFSFNFPWLDGEGNDKPSFGDINIPTPELPAFVLDLGQLSLPSLPNITKPDIGETIGGAVGSIAANLPGSIVGAVETIQDPEVEFDIVDSVQQITLFPKIEPIECLNLDLEDATLAITLMAKADGLDCMLYYFSSLGYTQSTSSRMLQGEYTGTFSYYDGLVEAQIAEQLAWKGLSCNDGVCTIINRVLPRYVESGPYTYETRCSLGLDYFPCLKIDFTAGENPRYFYTRIIDNTKTVTVVQLAENEDTTEGVINVHSSDYAGEYVPPIDWDLPDFAEFPTLPPFPEADPSDCMSLSLLNATLAANLMAKENGLQCMLNYYASLGPSQRVKNLSGALAGEYSGLYHWFADTSEQQIAAQARWKGMQCDGSTCSFINRRGNVVDVGEVTVAVRCPIGRDPYPCIRMDFGASLENPRVYFTRMSDAITFVSVVKLSEEGYYGEPGEDVANVNVLTLKDLE